MDHADHVNLLRGGVEKPGGIWADLGAGTGAFTLALADLIGPSGELHAIDRDERALEANARAMASRFPSVPAHHHVADFAEPLDLPPLDGIVMANALHFQPEARQAAIVQQLRRCLRPGGRFILVEYNIDRANPAVPHPVPFTRWEMLAREAGFGETRLLARRPSRFLREIYSALSR